jgi:hypothetical protein
VTFHILSPQSHERPDYTHAVVFYDTEQKYPGIGKMMAGTFVEIFAMLLLGLLCFPGALNWSSTSYI